ncbi:hypothetical protein AGLY_004261, partial [Aphis glycines]
VFKSQNVLYKYQMYDIILKSLASKHNKTILPTLLNTCNSISQRVVDFTFEIKFKTQITVMNLFRLGYIISLLSFLLPLDNIKNSEIPDNKLLFSRNVMEVYPVLKIEHYKHCEQLSLELLPCSNCKSKLGIFSSGLRKSSIVLSSSGNNLVLRHNLTNMTYVYTTSTSNYWPILRYYLSKYNLTDIIRLINFKY